MPVYLSMLRGINVGPHKRMKMEKLRGCCESLKFTGVKTYIQSGNIVLQAAKTNPAQISKKIEAQIAKEFGFHADVITRTKEELGDTVRKNPLLQEEGIDESKLHVVFLLDKPSNEAMRKLESIILSPDRVRFRGREIFFYFPNGVSGSSLWKHNLDKIMTISGTMRNWNTVHALDRMAAEIE